jgi:carbon monoxide dehydrogenase subunit G
MPGHSFRHSASTSVPPAEVWASLDKPATWEAIPGVDRVIEAHLDGTGRLKAFSFESEVGGRRYVGEATPAGREEGRLIAWDIDSSEVKGTVTVGLAPNDAGTAVDVRLDVEGAGMLGSLFFPVIAAAIGKGFPATVEDFVAGL